MTTSEFLLGTALFLITTGSSAVLAAVIARRRLAHLSGAPLGVAWAVLTLVVVLAVHLVPGIVGVLSRFTAAGVALAALALGVFLLRRRPSAEEPTAPVPPESGRLSWAIAGVAVAAVAAWTLAAAWSATVAPSIGLDTLTHHLPNVGKWIQTGSLWRVDQFVPLLANGTYPQSGDVITMAALLPWENDAFVRLVDFPLVAIAGVAAYAAAVELGASRSTAVLGGALLAGLPVVVRQGYQGTMTDPLFMAGFAAGLLFLLRYRRTRLNSDVVLAGLALGLAFGSKWYGVTAVAACLGVFLVASWLGRERLWRGLVAVGLVALAVGGFWLVRNWVETGNPVTPVPIRAAGVTIFSAPHDFVRECFGFTFADYLTDSGVIRDWFVPAFRENFGIGGIALAVGILIGGVLALRRPVQVAVLGLTALTLLLLGAYAVTPYTAGGIEGSPALADPNVRYLLPAVVSGVLVMTWAAARLGRARPAAELLILLGVCDGLRRGFDTGAGSVVLAALVLVSGGLAVYAGRAAWLRLPTDRRRPALIAGAVAAVALVALVAFVRQRDFNDDRYFGLTEPSAWIARHAPSGHRIGLSGVWGVKAVGPAWPAFGPMLGNDVEYVGPTVDGQLREYPSRRAFTGAVRAGRYDLLLVGRGGAVPRCAPIGPQDQELAWAREAGYPIVAREGALTLFRIPGR